MFFFAQFSHEILLCFPRIFPVNNDIEKSWWDARETRKKVIKHQIYHFFSPFPYLRCVCVCVFWVISFDFCLFAPSLPPWFDVIFTDFTVNKTLFHIWDPEEWLWFLLLFGELSFSGAQFFISSYISFQILSLYFFFRSAQFFLPSDCISMLNNLLLDWSSLQFTHAILLCLFSLSRSPSIWIRFRFWHNFNVNLFLNSVNKAREDDSLKIVLFYL